MEKNRRFQCAIFQAEGCLLCLCYENVLQNITIKRLKGYILRNASAASVLMISVKEHQNILLYKRGKGLHEPFRKNYLQKFPDVNVVWGLLVLEAKALHLWRHIYVFTV